MNNTIITHSRYLYSIIYDETKLSPSENLTLQIQRANRTIHMLRKCLLKINPKKTTEIQDIYQHIAHLEAAQEQWKWEAPLRAELVKFYLFHIPSLRCDKKTLSETIEKSLLLVLQHGIEWFQNLLEKKYGECLNLPPIAWPVLEIAREQDVNNNNYENDSINGSRFEDSEENEYIPIGNAWEGYV
jgi:hypothetical protein